MPPVPASAPAVDLADAKPRLRGAASAPQRPRRHADGPTCSHPGEPASPAALSAAYDAYLERTGRGNAAYWHAARAFLARWPDPARWAREPLPVRLAATSATRPFITFLMLHGWVRPGYDYLLSRKLSSIWRELDASPLGDDVHRFLDVAQQLGFSTRVRSAMASQVTIRLLVQSGHRLDELTAQDLTDLEDACRERRRRTGADWGHYRAGVRDAHLVLFHLSILSVPPRTTHPTTFDERLADVAAPLRASLVAYLERKRATCAVRTVTSTASRIGDFGTFLTRHDPDLTSLADLDRRRHVEPYLTWLVTAPNSKNDDVITVAERARRVLAVSNLLRDITEWGWPEAPRRQVVFRDDIPRLPRPLPRYLPHDADRRLQQALREHPDNPLAADALQLQRACGLRIGELLDLELDCVHEVPDAGAWLKVPLGKLDTERMVPLDPETLQLIDHITDIRSPGRPLPHPRYHRAAQFLFTHHGRRLSPNAVRAELDRAADDAGLAHVTPHQLRHTYATVLVNEGVSLQTLMALLGHVSAEMSLRYGRLFDQTVRGEYERALASAKQRLLPALPDTGITALDLVDGHDWRTLPLIKTRLAGGFCLRATSQGPCPHANLCEHCPSYHTTTGCLPALTAQQVDARFLADDAAARGWDDDAARHRALVDRLDILMARADGRTAANTA